MQNTLIRSLVLLLVSGLIALASALTHSPSQNAEDAPHSHTEGKNSQNETSPNHRAQPGHSVAEMEDGHDMAMTVDSEMSFITQMIPHHREAVSSSRALLEMNVRPELRYFAKTIIEVQARELELLQDWQNTWYPEAPRARYVPMMPALQGVCLVDAERDFLEGMVGHHQGALEMAQSYLGGTFKKHPEVERLARGIITAQQGEIAQMQAWLGAWFPQEASTGMHDMTMTVNSEMSFITQMIPHHREAVSSSQALRDLDLYPELRYFAKTIIQVQEREIGMLSGWKDAWYPDAPPATYMPMMPPLKRACPQKAQQEFLEGMVGHHQGALEMARSYLSGDFDKHPEVVRLAKAIVTAQEGEIAQMQAWLGAWFGNKKAAEQRPVPHTPAPTSEGHGSSSSH